jgi:hypothetical protein
MSRTQSSVHVDDVRAHAVNAGRPDADENGLSSLAPIAWGVQKRTRWFVEASDGKSPMIHSVIRATARRRPFLLEQYVSASASVSATQCAIGQPRDAER